MIIVAIPVQTAHCTHHNWKFLFVLVWFLARTNKQIYTYLHIVRICMACIHACRICMYIIYSIHKCIYAPCCWHFIRWVYIGIYNILQKLHNVIILVSNGWPTIISARNTTSEVTTTTITTKKEKEEKKKKSKSKPREKWKSHNSPVRLKRIECVSEWEYVHF